MGRFRKSGLILVAVVGALAFLSPFDNGQVFAQTISTQGKPAPNPSPQPVTVTNIPLPVTGNVGITGTPSVNVTNSTTLPVSVQNTSIPVTGPQKNVLALRLEASGIPTGSGAGVRVNLPNIGVAVLDGISAYCKGDVTTTGGEFTIASYMTQNYGVPQGVTFTTTVGSATTSTNGVYGAAARWALSSVPENTLSGAVFWNLPPSPVNIPVGNLFDIEVTLINSATILCEVTPVWHYE